MMTLVVYDCLYVMARIKGLGRALGKVIGRASGREVTLDADEAP